MDLGGSSLGLSVADIQASQSFYEKLGFEVVDGQFNHEGSFELEEGQDWLILAHGDTRLGLFQGMFDQNILTFHPPDVRALQRGLKGEGIAFMAEANEDTEGPANAMLQDPDGNVILLDQH